MAEAIPNRPSQGHSMSCHLNSPLIPEGSWDSHMHVIDPIKFPLSADTRYTPEPHSLRQALDKEKQVGLANIVLVQPSIYGYDNSRPLDTLHTLGLQRARGVMTFDPEQIDDSTLSRWHSLGVRGVRLNFQSVGKEPDSEELGAMLKRYADIVRPWDWIIQLYLPLATLEAIELVIPQLGVRVCLDHFGCPSLSSPLDAIPGFSSLERLILQGSTFVKFSAHYRICDSADQLEPMEKALLQINGGRNVVFATDWPHTRFSNVDVGPICGQCTGLVRREPTGRRQGLPRQRENIVEWQAR